ncbi:MAG TPA: hypothetical protein VLX68_01310 [Chitinivibrionales bacterium]|nr:hypothetical protein [Chitinivibrionales bacterium]
MKRARESADDFWRVFEALLCAGAKGFSTESSIASNESEDGVICLSAAALREEESCLAEVVAAKVETAGKAKKITEKRNSIFLQCRINGKSLFPRKRKS